MRNTIENENEIKTTCELEDKEFEVITHKKTRTIMIYNLGGRDRKEKPIFVSMISKDDDISECHQKTIEYMVLNNNVPEGKEE